MKIGDKVKFIAVSGNEYEIEIEESGAFAYGNRTCAVYRKNGKIYDSEDTRYYKGTIDKYCTECLEWNVFGEEISEYKIYYAPKK